MVRDYRVKLLGDGEGGVVVGVGDGGGEEVRTASGVRRGFWTILWRGF